MQDFAAQLDQIGRAAGMQLDIASMSAVAGGDINQAVQVFDTQGRACFLKLNQARFADMFGAEAAGLQELDNAHALHVPEVYAHGCTDEYAWLLIEWLDLVPASEAASAELGRALADMHRVQQESFGWWRDNTIGRTPQPNTVTDDWLSFWRQHRLGYQLQLAEQNGAGNDVVQAGQQLLANLDVFFTDYEPVPSLLHGDLWGGNWGVLRDGRPCLFDPAIYYGDREADIAMTRLFGGFDSAFYRAYGESWPLDAGYEKRQDLYNLYHILNHYNLFGGHYLAQASRMLQSLTNH